MGIITKGDIDMENRFKKIVETTGMPRPEICRRYGIARSTIDGWYYGEREPLDYLMDLLERCIREDMEKDRKDPDPISGTTVKEIAEELGMKRGDVCNAYGVSRHMLEKWYNGEHDTFHDLLAEKMRNDWNRKRTLNLINRAIEDLTAMKEAIEL